MIRSLQAFSIFILLVGGSGSAESFRPVPGNPGRPGIPIAPGIQVPPTLGFSRTYQVMLPENTTMQTEIGPLEVSRGMVQVYMKNDPTTFIQPPDKELIEKGMLRQGWLSKPIKIGKLVLPEETGLVFNDPLRQDPMTMFVSFPEPKAIGGITFAADNISLQAYEIDKEKTAQSTDKIIQLKLRKDGRITVKGVLDSELEFQKWTMKAATVFQFNATYADLEKEKTENFRLMGGTIAKDADFTVGEGAAAQKLSLREGDQVTWSEGYSDDPRPLPVNPNALEVAFTRGIRKVSDEFKAKDRIAFDTRTSKVLYFNLAAPVTANGVEFAADCARIWGVGDRVTLHANGKLRSGCPKYNGNFELGGYKVNTQSGYSVFFWDNGKPMSFTVPYGQVLTFKVSDGSSLTANYLPLLYFNAKGALKLVYVQTFTTPGAQVKTGYYEMKKDILHPLDKKFVDEVVRPATVEGIPETTHLQYGPSPALEKWLKDRE